MPYKLKAIAGAVFRPTGSSKYRELFLSKLDESKDTLVSFSVISSNWSSAKKYCSVFDTMY
jgi:hypothetical protein